MSRKSTITDVAKLANVSKSTVSYVLSGKRPIGSKVTEEVLDAMEKLNYKPSIVARNLAERQTNNIGLYAPSTTSISQDLFFNNILSGIIDCSIDNGYRVIIYPEKRDEGEEINYELDRSQPIDGALIMNPDLSSQYLTQLKKEMLPFVLIGSPANNTDIFYVDTDNIALTYNATNYLISKGHKSILFINGPKEYVGSDQKEKGYRLALSEKGIKIDEKLIRNAKIIKESGYSICKELLEEDTNFTAILVINDIVAVGTLKALKERQKKVPKDVAVLSVGNTMLADIHSPSITSIDVSGYELGFAATSLLIDVIKKKTISSCSRIIPTEIVEREST